jgi:benzoyl-CoA reductase/2-hydroxyglutaryl-CoA dehydratase subunit BcrC/BadD/HgdB
MAPATATYVSSNAGQILRYPEETKERFLAQGTGLTLRDGRQISAAEIWDWVSEEGPRRFPNLFTVGKLFGPSDDVHLLSGIKRLWLSTTLSDRLSLATAKGIPVVFIQGGQGHEPYYAAGAIPSRPAHVGSWALNLKEGQTWGDANLRRQQQREQGHNALTVDACQTAGYGIIQDGTVPIAAVAPYLCNRCSDIAFGVEAHRHGPVKLPLGLVDVPVNGQAEKPWAARYTAEGLRKLVAQLAELSGKKVSDEDLWREFKLHNRKRQLAREYLALWWAAKEPPTNSSDHGGIFGLGNESHADPVAALQVLEESVAEVKERIAQGVRGHGLQPNPVRIFVCGSCVNPNLRHTDEVGGVVAGKDDGYSEIFFDVPEQGADPYLALAETILKYPYEQDTLTRANWTAEQVRAARADGILFMYQWGCNYQSGIARLIVDEVGRQVGIPSMVIERTFAENPTGHEQLNTRLETFVAIARDSRS